jgi:hypothetical protein
VNLPLLLFGEPQRIIFGMDARLMMLGIGSVGFVIGFWWLRRMAGDDDTSGSFRATGDRRGSIPPLLLGALAIVILGFVLLVVLGN